MHYRPLTELPTHSVTNQPPALGDMDFFAGDAAFAEAVAREGSPQSVERAKAYGRLVGSEEVRALGVDANRHPPELVSFDRYGRRLDEVRFHPAYHRLMEIGITHRQPAVAWSGEAGGHVSHAALEFILHQVDAGVCCPLSMTYAGIPALRTNPALARQWEAKFLSDKYDPRFLPMEEKAGCTMGMAMTEKQGGSDVRANSTRATRLAGSDGEYSLRGHKWFCSAPMSDAFLTLAYAEGGLTCFFVPRWTPDGERNRIFIQRLKDKLGNRSNASSEIEYHDAWAVRVGEEGRGVPTIIEMVHHTRLDTTVGAAALMRRALVEAMHHATHRSAFQRRLVDQPLMQSVLADLAIESEAATLLTFRIARAFDDTKQDESARDFARLAVALAKYWLNKRVVGVVYEALEVIGGGGYVEESPMAWLYREAPLNGIWEGSGNVIALDLLRTMAKAPRALDLYLAEIGGARGADRRFDAAIDALAARLSGARAEEATARRLAEEMALLLQGALLLRHAPAAVADAFVATRLAGDWGHAYGTLPAAADRRAIIDRVRKDTDAA
ncbi:MAG: acyl-CoA dehydrogenase family protein [Rhodothalassiaceae bacterium]